MRRIIPITLALLWSVASGWAVEAPPAPPAEPPGSAGGEPPAASTPSAPATDSAGRPTKTALAERFDVSGLPDNATGPFEKELLALIRAHRPGDMKEAVEIQRRLAVLYKQQGDQPGSMAASQRARIGLTILNPRPAAPPPAPKPQAPQPPLTPVAAPVAPANPSVPVPQDFSGKFYGFVNGVEHRWDFLRDGTYLHRVTGSGGGTDTGTTERGNYLLSADRKSIELRSTKPTPVAATPAAGTNTTTRIRRLSLNLNGPRSTHGTGIVMDEVEYNVRP